MNLFGFKKASNRDLVAAAKEALRDSGPFVVPCIEHLSKQYPKKHPYELYRALRVAARELFEQTWLGSLLPNDTVTMPDTTQFGSPATPLGRNWQDLELARLQKEFAQLLIEISIQDIAPILSRRGVQLELILTGHQPTEEMVDEGLLAESELGKRLESHRKARKEIYELLSSRENS